jgi:hypothetical protein
MIVSLLARPFELLPLPAAIPYVVTIPLMTVPLASLLALAAGVLVLRTVLRRPLPVIVPLPEPQPAERAVWSRSARELYRTVQGVVEDLDVCLLATPVEPHGLADPAAVRALLGGAITRARGATSWAVALGEQALGAETEGVCDRLATGLAALAEAAHAALADPADPEGARRLEAERLRARRDAQRLVRLL